MGLLVAFSAILIFAGEKLQLPAAMLLGAMLGAILMAAGESTLRVHRWLSLAAQGVVGCLIARSITAEFFTSMGQHLPVILLSVGYVLLPAPSSAICWRGFAFCREQPPYGVLPRGGHGNDADGGIPRRGCPPRRVHAISARGAGCHSRFAGPAPQHRCGNRCACRNHMVSTCRLVHTRTYAAADRRRRVPRRTPPHSDRRHARAAHIGRIASRHRLHHHRPAAMAARGQLSAHRLAHRPRLLARAPIAHAPMRRGRFRRC